MPSGGGRLRTTGSCMLNAGNGRMPRESLAGNGSLPWSRARRFFNGWRRIHFHSAKRPSPICRREALLHLSGFLVNWALLPRNKREAGSFSFCGIAIKISFSPRTPGLVSKQGRKWRRLACRILRPGKVVHHSPHPARFLSPGSEPNFQERAIHSSADDGHDTEGWI